MTATDQSLFVKCTDREIDALGWLIHDGASNETIARRMGVDIETAKSHLSRIMRRTDIPTRTALAVAILRGSLVVFDPRGRRVQF